MGKDKLEGFVFVFSDELTFQEGTSESNTSLWESTGNISRGVLEPTSKADWGQRPTKEADNARIFLQENNCKNNNFMLMLIK